MGVANMAVPIVIQELQSYFMQCCSGFYQLFVMISLVWKHHLVQRTYFGR